MHLFWHDLRRLARHGRPALGRIVLGLVLLTVLAATFVRWFPVAEISDLTTTYIHDQRRLSGFARQFVFVLNLAQLIALVIVTPIVCGAALPTERVRGTLDLLRISQTSSETIVFGKFAARFVYLASYLAFCLPVTMALELWGSADFALIASSFAIHLLTLAVLVGLSLACTADSKSVAAGVAVTYGYLGLLTLATQFVPWTSPLAIFGGWQRGGMVTYVGSIIGYAGLCIPLSAACLIAAAIRVARDDERRQPGFVPMSGSRAAPPAELDARLLAPIDVRPLAFLHRPFSSYLPRVASIRIFHPPRVRDRPLLWKELNHGGNPLAAELLRTVSLGIIVIEAIAGIFLIVNLMNYVEVPPRIVRQWNAILQPIVLSSLSVAVLSCAAFAAGSITQEHEHRTLDALMALPHGRLAVLFTKWLCSILRVRWPIAAIILPLVAGAMVGSFHPLAAAVLALAAVVQLAFAATLGLFCSVFFSGTGRSMLAAVLVMLFCTLLPTGWIGVSLGKLGGATPLRTVESLGAALSPLASWQSLLDPSAAAAPGLNFRVAILSVAMFACATSLLTGLAILGFARKSQA